MKISLEEGVNFYQKMQREFRCNYYTEFLEFIVSAPEIQGQMLV